MALIDAPPSFSTHPGSRKPPPLARFDPLATATGSMKAPTVVAEALECLGGNGYVEESGMMLYREAPLSSIREGSGNVTALDLLRALDPPTQFPLKSKAQFQ